MTLLADNDWRKPFALDYAFRAGEKSLSVHADCFEWLRRAPQDSIHAIVTDPPYGVKEYDFDQLEKRGNGNGGVWRIPPSFDGHERSPLPRFTAFSAEELERLRDFFRVWARLALNVLKPGGHIFLASNALLSQVVFSAIVEEGLEFRGQIMRLVQTLRGGDRPKNAEDLFPDVCTMPRGGYEPWGLFRKPLPVGMTVKECLLAHQTGGLRRKPDGRPFEDVIDSERTPRRERNLAAHPSLKPQSFLRQIVYAALPLGSGIVLDPFMGSGSTLAAAEFVGYQAIGIERHRDYYQLSAEAIPALADLNIKQDQLELFPAKSL